MENWSQLRSGGSVTSGDFTDQGPGWRTGGAVGQIGLIFGVTSPASLGISRGRPAVGEVAATAHGATRLADPTRLGAQAVQDVMGNATRSGLQRDGARVYIQHVGDRFNVVVMGDRGLVTNLKTISERSLTRLSKKYGYELLLR